VTDHTDFTAVIDAFHEAALEPELWQAALRRLGALVGGSGVVVLSAYNPAAGPQLLQTIGFDHRYWGRFRTEHGEPETNRYIELFNVTPPGQVLQPRVSMLKSQWDADPINRKFLRPDRLEDGLACPLFHQDDGFAAVAVFRGRHYERDHVHLLRSLAPYVRHALHVHLRLSTHATGAAALGALDRLRMGVVLADSQCRLVYANPPGQRILDRADGLSVGSGGFLLAAAGADEPAAGPGQARA
jgi:hypothetical protein